MKERIEGLGDYFIYDSNTGDLVWRPRPVSDFVDQRAQKIWNTKWAGRVAGWNRRAHKAGRPSSRVVQIKRITHSVARIVWEMHNGPTPEGMVIDHINGDPWDNRLPNLRPVTPSQNSHNTRVHFDCRSGFKGVSRSDSKAGWCATIRANGVKKHLGSFPTKEEAAIAYNAAAIKLHGEFARLNEI